MTNEQVREILTEFGGYSSSLHNLNWITALEEKAIKQLGDDFLGIDPWTPKATEFDRKTSSYHTWMVIINHVATPVHGIDPVEPLARAKALVEVIVKCNLLEKK